MGKNPQLSLKCLVQVRTFVGHSTHVTYSYSHPAGLAPALRCESRIKRSDSFALGTERDLRLDRAPDSAALGSRVQH